MYTTKTIEEQIQIFPKMIIGTLAYCLIATLFFPCTDADKFYDKLDTQPEVVRDFKAIWVSVKTARLRLPLRESPLMWLPLR